MNDIKSLKIADLKLLVKPLTAEELPSWIEQLRSDERSAVQKLSVQLEKRLSQYHAETEKSELMLIYEKQAMKQGFLYVAGIDEAGRGPLVSSVVAAAVILNPDVDWRGIDDSKKLSEEKRNMFYDLIIERALAYGIGAASSQEIDEVNILNATKLAMKRAIKAMALEADYLLIDAVKLEDVETPQLNLIKGDAKSASIAAASILAKVTRDRMLVELDEKYPLYGFAKHKGYGTDQHYDAIRKFGLIPEHRRSFLKNI